MTLEAKAAIGFLCRHRDHMTKRLADYESGAWKVGRIEGGIQIDETANTIEYLKSRIADLDQVIATYEKSK